MSKTEGRLIGIDNENEFYSRHYLAEVFSGDIAETLAEWRDSPQKPPYRRLADLHQMYFKMRGAAERTPDPSTRLDQQRLFSAALLEALDLEQHPSPLTLADGTVLPILAQLNKNGQAQLVVIEVFQGEPPDFSGKERPSVLATAPHPCQYSHFPGEPDIPEATYDQLLSDALLAADNPPRRVLLLDGGEAVLVDRHKWTANRILRFDFAEILGRRDDDTLKAMAVLLHRDSLCPDSGESLLERLDENAHRHAYRVSEDLKYALREAIEMLGNEALYSCRVHLKFEPFEGPNALNEADFSRECLRFMYRLLFLFYIEARPELKYVPIRDNDTYRLGYSLESLRDLELVKLETSEAREGFFFQESLQRLFHMIFRGYRGGEEDGPGIIGAFTIPPLDSHLFDPERTPTLQKVKLRNVVLQDIINKMSLSRPSGKGKKGRGKNKRRGRVSYAQLGINQLGEVYEALLSYRGFFAREDLYEVKKAGTQVNELETGYFVNAQDLEAYEEAEKVYVSKNGFQALKVHPQGSFIYRMAGRDRQKSASYYTPEVLTKCLVKYSLKELLKDAEDGRPFPADDILNLTICEPAMGSAAFLNEAVNQLSEAYLTRKQSELGQRIPHEAYATELQKVKMYIADHNCFGVDLNPVAVELAEVSLWLNAIHGTDQVPWFGYQLFAGNSLVGARRQVYHRRQLRIAAKGSKNDLWYYHAPTRLTPASLNGNGEGRNSDEIYHFLLPDPGMAEYKDKVVKSLKPDEIKTISAWKRKFCAPFERAEIKTLLTISAMIDDLWAEHVRLLRADRNDTEDHLTVWPHEAKDKSRDHRTSTREKDQRRTEGLFNFERPFASPMMQLKMVMDYWCALWFWPIEKAHLLPTRKVFLHHIHTILQGERSPKQMEEIQDALFAEERDPLDVKAAELRDDGQVSLKRINEFFPQLALVDHLAKSYRFFHWELIFADVFADRGGFNLILGNPPWLKVEWEEGGIMGDEKPLLVLRKFSAKQLADQRKETLERNCMASYLTEYEGCGAYQRFLNASQNFPLLKGIPSNLYKCFLPQAWMIDGPRDVAGFIHPDGVFDDPNGGLLRASIYQHLSRHYQFQNEKNLFKEIGNQTKFSLNIYQVGKKEIGFQSISNLFLPQTIDESSNHSGLGKIPGIKNSENKWELSGHQSRIIFIDKNSLSLFSKLYCQADTLWTQARLPALHSNNLMEVLFKIERTSKTLWENTDQWFCTSMLNETTQQKDDTIKRNTSYTNNKKNWIVSGPHFYVGNPLNKTPRSVCNTNKSYDTIDLIEIPYDYLPRTNYIPSSNFESYQKRMKTVLSPTNEPAKEPPKILFRNMINSSAERTLISAVFPAGTAHINTCLSVSLNNIPDCLALSAATFSIPIDFFIKSTGKSHFFEDLLKLIPLTHTSQHIPELHSRVLLLTCLTSDFIVLWKMAFQKNYKTAKWTMENQILNNKTFAQLNKNWEPYFPLRTPYERRQVLIEIDVIVAMDLNLSLENLITIYQIYFYVMQNYERETFYDQKGRIVFTINKGLAGVGLNRKPKKGEPPCTITYPDGTEETGPKGWEDVRDLPAGVTVSQTKEDDTLPGGPRQKTITYYAPFFRCDRVEDYRIAWAEFTRRFNEEKNDTP